MTQLVINVIIYCRVSLDNKIQDPEVQLKVLQEYALHKGYNVLEVFMEKERGQFTIDQRIEFKKALGALTRPEVQGMLCVRVDRLVKDDRVKLEVDDHLKANPTKWIEYSDSGQRWTGNMDESVELSQDVVIAVTKQQRKIQSRRIKEGKAKMLIDAATGKRIGRRGNYEGKKPNMALNPITGKYDRYIDPNSIIGEKTKGFSDAAVAEILGCSRKMVWRTWHNYKKSSVLAKAKKETKNEPLKPEIRTGSSESIIGI